MASIDRCVRILQSRSERYFADLEENLTTFYRKVQDLKHLKVLTEEDFSKEEGYAFDPTKILIYTGDTDMTGKELMDILTASSGPSRRATNAPLLLSLKKD